MSESQCKAILPTKAVRPKRIRLRLGEFLLSNFIPRPPIDNIDIHKPIHSLTHIHSHLLTYFTYTGVNHSLTHSLVTDSLTHQRFQSRDHNFLVAFESRADELLVGLSDHLRERGGAAY